MPRYAIIFLLTCVLLTLATSSAVARNDLEIFGLPTPPVRSQVKSAFDGQFNLVLDVFTAPDTASQGEDISETITLSVRNAGPDPLLAKFAIRIILSASQENPAPMTAYVFWISVPGLGAGEVWNFDIGAVIPFPAATGVAYLVAQVDPGNTVVETVEADNIASLPIFITESPRTLVYYEDFQGGDGGWAPRDLTEQDTHLQHIFYTPEGDDNEYGVWWCGDDNPDWGTPPGYGSFWDQRLTKLFELDDGDSLTVTYAIQYDTEPDNDHVYVEVSDNNGAVFTPLADYTGSTDGEFRVYTHDLSAYGSHDLLIRFRFTSDISWDDEVGNFDSEGAFRLDYVEVTGFDVDDFEFDGSGWEPSTADPVGGEFRLVNEPYYPPGLPGDVYDTGESATTCNAWVAYDPATLEFPEASTTDLEAGRHLEIVIESPGISLPTVWSHVLLSFDVFQDVPLENGVFFRWFVSVPGGSWISDGYLYFGTEGWNRREFDITDKIPADATSLRIRLAANDFGQFWDWVPPVRNAAPFFDNVQIVVSESSEPGLDPVSYPRACGWSVDDLDGDGVPDVDDMCPTVSAAFFDRDGDGCIDPVIGSRHIEYWSADALPLGYVIHEGGAPGVSDGSDFTDIQAGFATWTTVPGVEVSVNYLGTTADPDANAMDFVNTVTFADPDFVFPSGVLAVGLSTSYLTPVVDGATVYRPGQIIDSDMIFNPAQSFQTSTMGSGVDIQSIVTHEAGHMLGLSHSAVPTSTMFYVLQPLREAAVLSVEDEMAMFRAYPQEAALETASHLRGAVYDGLTGSPVPGVIVYAIEALPGDAEGDTVACEYTLPDDGSYHFAGLADGDYFVAIHPLDGSSSIGYIQPANINQLIYSKAEALVVPEYWDAAESNTDDSETRTAINVTAGATVTADIITNIDDTAPFIVSFSPEDGAIDVAVSTAVLFQFSEAVAGDSFIGNFNFTPVGGGDFVPGNAALVQDDHTLMYVPASNLSFDTTYEVEIGDTVRDLFGNDMGEPFLLTFSTGSQPAVYIDNLTPGKAIGGALVVINGAGFGSLENPATVTLGAVPLPVLEWASDRLLVEVPEDMATGPADLVVTDPLGSGNATVLFTVLAPDKAARGLEIATVDLPGLPRVVEVTPDGAVSFVATDAGLAIIDVSVSASPELSFIPVSGGLNDLDVSPDGQNVYAVSRTNEKLYRFQYDASVVPPGEPATLLNEISLTEAPRGILIDPSGKRAYLTTVGEIQVWDINPASATFENQVGSLVGSGPVLLGPLAVDPAGRYLLANTGIGVLAVFDLDTATLVAEAPVQSNPIDVQVDPTGSRAYVSDDNGYLSVIDLSDFSKEIDIATGGSLKGAAVTPTASFVYVANHQSDDIDVIDLREGSATHLGVATRIPTRVNPVDVVFSPDGIHAYSLVEYEQKFVITAVGAGPLLTGMTPTAGPPGTLVVLSGSGFTDATVSFNGIPVPVDAGGEGYLTMTVPLAAVSGPITVVGVVPGEVSNSVEFTVLVPVDDGTLNAAGTVHPVGEPQFSNALAIAPDGDLVVIGGDDGRLYLFVTDPVSSSYQQFHETSSFFNSAVSGLSVAPDASVVYVSSLVSGDVQVVDVNPDNSAFGEAVHVFHLQTSGIGNLASSPDGSYLLAADPDNGFVHVIDLAADSYFSTPIPQGPVGEMVFHPGGAFAYLTVLSNNPAVVTVLDMSPSAAPLGEVTAVVPLMEDDPDKSAVSLTFDPDGHWCYILISQETGSPNRSIISLDTTNPSNPVNPIVLGEFPTESASMAEHIRVSPAGDRAVFNIRGEGLFQVGLDPVTLPASADVVLGSEALVFAFAPDGSNLYVADTQDDAVHIFDFNGDSEMVKVWGDEQTGVAGEILASSLRVRVSDPEGNPSAEKAVTFEVTGGGGSVSTDASPVPGTVLTLATDVYGYAQVNWTLGTVFEAQLVTASSGGVAGSPVTFNATAIENPELLPLELVHNLFSPADGTIDVSVTTAIQATFSRPLDTGTIHPDSYFIWNQSTASKILTIVGFSNGDRNVSLTPVDELMYGTSYSVVVSGDIRDTAGGALANPTDFTFATTDPPAAPVLAAVSPPSSTCFVNVILSGMGFDPIAADNRVYFVNGNTMEELAAFVTDGATDYLRATVPSGAASGFVYVSNSTGTSNQIPFTVLLESTLPADDIIGSVNTGTPAKTVTVSPDGAMAYALSPEADLTIPIDLNTLATLPAIPVGDEPWAIAVHPAGTFAYVANRLSGDVSVIDIQAGSATLHDVVETLNVGIEPMDIVVTPAGDRLIVANFGSSDLSVIDTDETSASFHNVIGTVRTGTASKTITVSPDGTRIYVGTDTGYIVIGTVDYGVIGRVTTGTPAKTLTVSPDGALLVLLDVTGEITLFDITPGSDTENQVIASVRTGTGAKTATVSPDGALLYVVMEENDVVQVFDLTVGTSIGVIGSQSVKPVVELELVATLRAGENPEFIAFLPDGSGEFVVANSGDNTVSVFGGYKPGMLAGRIFADCPEPDTGLLGVLIDIFANETGDLLVTMVTDTLGYYGIELPVGDYNVTVVTPLGYSTEEEVMPVTISGGSTVTVDWLLDCLEVIPDPRPMSYWKHQVGTALKELKNDGEDGPTLCRYLDSIVSHFNNQPINQVIIYDPPASDECMDKLLVAKDLLNLTGDDALLSLARQQAIALLFNVTSGRLFIQEVVSDDGATLSQAITYLDMLIDDGLERNDLKAMFIGKLINKGFMVPSGFIPTDLPEISYLPRVGRNRLQQNFPNPFNPTATIRFEIARPQHVRLNIYDIRGRLVRTLVDELRQANSYEVVWDGTNNRGGAVASGVYFYRMTAGGFVQTHKMMLLK